MGSNSKAAVNRQSQRGGLDTQWYQCSLCHGRAEKNSKAFPKWLEFVTTTLNNPFWIRRKKEKCYNKIDMCRMKSRTNLLCSGAFMGEAKTSIFKMLILDSVKRTENPLFHITHPPKTFFFLLTISLITAKCQGSQICSHVPLSGPAGKTRLLASFQCSRRRKCIAELNSACQQGPVSCFWGPNQKVTSAIRDTII